MDCNITIGVMYLLVFILAIIMVGATIREGKSEKKMVSWTLYGFSIVFGLVALGILFFLKCDNGSNKKAKQIAIPVLTVSLCLANMIGMIIAKPQLSNNELFTPHLVNILLLIGSIFLGFGLCNNSGNSSSSSNTSEEEG